VLSDLLEDGKGSEIYMRLPGKYRLGKTARPTFAELAELTQMQNETAIGYTLGRGRIVLAPPLDEPIPLNRGSKIIVIANN
jgi:hypothetical protein